MRDHNEAERDPKAPETSPAVRATPPRRRDQAAYFRLQSGERLLIEKNVLRDTGERSMVRAMLHSPGGAVWQPGKLRVTDRRIHFQCQLFFSLFGPSYNMGHVRMRVFQMEIPLADVRAVHADRPWLPLLSGELDIETTDGAAYRFRVQGAHRVARVIDAQVGAGQS